MTLTLNLAPAVEEQLQRRATATGVPMTDIVARIVEDATRTDQSVMESDGPSLLDEMIALGVIGAVAGTPGPGDGRAWSEIEAPCDPL